MGETSFDLTNPPPVACLLARSPRRRRSRWLNIEQWPMLTMNFLLLLWVEAVVRTLFCSIRRRVDGVGRCSSACLLSVLDFMVTKSTLMRRCRSCRTLRSRAGRLTDNSERRTGERTMERTRVSFPRQASGKSREQWSGKVTPTRIASVGGGSVMGKKEQAGNVVGRTVSASGTSTVTVEGDCAD